MAQTTDMSELVETALQQPDQNSVAAVVAAGDAAVPDLAARLKRAHPGEHASLIGMLQAICSQQAAEALAPYLSVPDYDTKVRASAAVYACVSRSGMPEGKVFAEHVLTSLADGPEAGTLLVAGYIPQSETALKRHLGAGWLVKLSLSDPPVPAGLAAATALSLLGNQAARGQLETAIQEGDAAILLFLIRALQMIDAPEILHGLAAAALTNDTAVGDGLPSGVSPPRRLGDVAVEAFVRRLDLDPGFELDTMRRYSDAERGTISRLMRESLPN